MSQGLFNALLMGPKESEGARKVIKLVAFYGFVTVGLSVAMLFIPYEPLQEAIAQRIESKMFIIISAVFSYICFFFLLKEKLWAPSLLLALTMIDFIFTYMETREFMGSVSGIELLLYGTALQSAYFLKKAKRSALEVQTQND